MNQDRPPLYQEALRPQFHFTARYWDDYRLNPGRHQEGWINDVNGLVYLDGEYHLFAQRWWSCWLHAVSRDLIHWEELPPAFGKDERGGTQSGSAVVDYDNRSGLATGKTPVIVAFWSGTDNLSQCISYSNDYGRSWAKYAGNPVLTHPHRDPKVFWHEPEGKWVMVLYGPPERSYLLFSSPNLLTWTRIGEPIPDMYECPDMFELPVDGDPGRRKWVVVNGDGCYVTGEFDGTRFKVETPKARGDFGRNFYATMTWNGMPKENPRRIQAAWMKGGEYPDMPFNQQITFPCELTLRSLPEGLRLCRYPIAETERLRVETFARRDLALGSGDDPLRDIVGELFDVEMEIDAPASRSRGLTLDARGRAVRYDFAQPAVESCGARAEIPPRSGAVRLRVLIDRMSVETFGNLGEVSVTNCARPAQAGAALSLKAEGGTAVLKTLTVRRLKSIWRA